MTEHKPGRPTSPCAKCGGSDRYAGGNCKPCYREYMREYRKRWIAKRKAEMKAESNREELTL